MFSFVFSFLSSKTRYYNCSLNELREEEGKGGREIERVKGQLGNTDLSSQDARTLIVCDP